MGPEARRTSMKPSASTRAMLTITQHALSYIILRRFPEAERKLDQVLNITPDDVDTVGYKADIAQAEGDLRRAGSLLLLRLHPSNFADESRGFLSKQCSFTQFCDLGRGFPRDSVFTLTASTLLRQSARCSETRFGERAETGAELA